MSQIPDIAPSQMRPIGETKPTKPARVRKPAADVGGMTDGELADEHRGQVFAKMRAADRLKAIEAELTRRGLVGARGKVAVVSKQFGDTGLLDLDRIRFEFGAEFCRKFAVPGSDVFWRSKAL